MKKNILPHNCLDLLDHLLDLGIRQALNESDEFDAEPDWIRVVLVVGGFLLAITEDDAKEASGSHLACHVVCGESIREMIEVWTEVIV